MLKKVFYERFLCSEIKLKFDFYVDTTWKIKFHQSINSFLCWVDDVYQTFVCTHFKLFARIFIFVSRTNNCVKTAFSWKRNWSSNCSTCTCCSFNDFSAAVSSVRCSYAFKRIRIFLFAIFSPLVYLR